MKLAKSGILLLVILFLGSCNQPQETVVEKKGEVQHKPSTIFLVRHAEKVDASQDPALSEEGKARALALAQVLKDAKISHIYSSDFIRTRETAAPLASKLSLETEIYNPRELEELAEKIKAMGGIHLVVGHSNTTPKLASILGGDPHTQINEPYEYDRLYIIQTADNGHVHSTLMRYGKSYTEE